MDKKRKRRLRPERKEPCEAKALTGGAIEERVYAEAKYILETGGTVRACAKEAGVGKTTVHKDMRERLRRMAPDLALEVGRVLDKNREERHLRGGEATRRKYKADEAPR